MVSSAVSVALLFDTTGSMQNALPPLKSAALKLIGEMRPTDAVAVYSFNVAGSDNQSVLMAEIAIARARKAAAPIYTLAQRSALRDSGLLDQLSRISKSTGGLPFAIHEPAEVLQVFDGASRDLTHGYLLTFQPPPDQSGGWHRIKVTLSAPNERTHRAGARRLLAGIVKTRRAGSRIKNP